MHSEGSADLEGKAPDFRESVDECDDRGTLLQDYSPPKSQLELKEQTLHQPGSNKFKTTNRAIGFMVLAQLFSSLMSVSIRILENSSSKMHPLQVHQRPNIG
jgi:hypothetical protein